MQYDPTPICVPCHKEMTCYKNSVLVLCKTRNTDGELDPYALRSADMYICVDCGNKQMKGFSTGQVEEWEPQFKDLLARWNEQEPEFQVWWR